jgi:prolyl 4-hydroxylase
MPRSVLTQLSHSPRVYVADDFVTDAEIRHVLAVTDPAAVAARGLAASRDETGFSFELPVDGDSVLESIRSRIESVTGIANDHGNTFRFRHYLPSQAHPPHLDCYEIAGSHLVLTALINLVDCETGGATRFPRAWPTPVAVPPRRGRLVTWFNYYPNGAPDQSSYHEGAAIERGEKVTITAFVYAPLSAAATVPPGVQA